LKRIIGIILVVVGAILVRGLDWLSEASIFIGIMLAALGLWLALTKSRKNTESKFVGGSSQDLDDFVDD